MEKTLGQDRSSWLWPLLYVVVSNLVVFAPAVFLERDLGLLMFLFAVAAISLILIAMLVRNAIARRSRRCVAIMSMLVLVWTISAVLATNQVGIRSAARWFAFSKYYKTTVLAEPVQPGGQLKHAEWDGWGWAGDDTTVYLVFDPGDSLLAAAKEGRPGAFIGIPCEVYSVHRLEQHWYTVQFYTNELWQRCGSRNDFANNPT